MEKIIEIKDLHMKAIGFKLKAVVLSKTEVRTYGNNKGKLFSCNISDNTSIKLTVFNDLVDSLNDVLEVNEAVYIENVNIKIANTKYACSNEKGLELIANCNTIITPCNEKPVISVKLTPVRDIHENCFPNQLISMFYSKMYLSQMLTVST